MAGFVRRGEQYLESLRDGREVWYGGEKIRDVTEHPLTAPAIRTLAKIYDQQHDPSLVDVMTSFRADGARIATSWLAPRTPAELARKRKDLEQRCWASYGSFLGRQPGIVSWNLIGMNAHIGIFKQYCAEYADNLPAYLKQAQEQDLYLVGASVEPQGHRSRSAKAGENRSAILQVTKRSEKGIWLTGAKAVATGAPQANDILIGSVNYPHVLPDESFWVSVPVASPGLKLVCREASVWPSGAGHPIAAMGEEADAFLVLDNVFVPKDRIFALDEPELCDGSIFQRAARGESWAALIRLAVRAEFLVGVAQMVVEALDTVEVPLVRESVGRIIEFSQVLRAGVIAAETMATPAEDGTLLPETALTAACRAYALENYPRVIQVLQELCGQGTVMRFLPGDLGSPEIGPHLSRYLDAAQVSAKEKNQLMELVWDTVMSPMATRLQAYENLQGFGPSQRMTLFAGVDRTGAVARIRGMLGLKQRPPPVRRGARRRATD
jgi:4-hydroxyphenylacetate 3-monooxygenase